MGNCGSSQPKAQRDGDDIKINTDTRQRTRQTAQGTPTTQAAPVEVSHEIPTTATDKRTEENEQLRVIISATNRKFIGVASLSYETPPGLEEASQRYKTVVLGAPPQIPSSIFALPHPSTKTDAIPIGVLLGEPMDTAGQQIVKNAAESLTSALEEMSIPVNPQDLIVEWSVASSLHMRA